MEERKPSYDELVALVAELRRRIAVLEAELAEARQTAARQAAPFRRREELKKRAEELKLMLAGGQRNPKQNTVEYYRLWLELLSRTGVRNKFRASNLIWEIETFHADKPEISALKPKFQSLISSDDLGGPAYRKFDLEAWMPGRGSPTATLRGEWGEITSTSTDYQTRRLGIRYKKKGEKRTHFAHTLNGTAVANTRSMIALIENYQQADGIVLVPEVLRKWVGKDRIVQSK